MQTWPNDVRGISRVKAMAQQYQLVAAMATRSTVDGGQQGRILSLVQGCARDQSFGQNYLDQLNRRSIELIPQLELARSVLHEKKQQKKSAEEELRSLEVELAAAQATIQARQARVESKQLEIADATLQLETLKNNEAMERDRFINVMLELNTSILRVHNEIQKSVVCPKCGTSEG